MRHLRRHDHQLFGVLPKVIAGTRAKKVRSKSYNAFSSIDYPCLAVIQDGVIMRYIPMLPCEGEARFYEELDGS